MLYIFGAILLSACLSISTAAAIHNLNLAFAENDFAIDITFVDNPTPKWGLDEIGTVGSVSINTPLDSTVDLDWGDGTDIVPGLPLDEFGQWGPAFHTYDKEATESNPNEIVVTLRASNGTLLDISDPYPIEVQKYETILTLSSIPSVVAGEEISFSGSLIDTQNSVPLVDKQITFSGTGIDNGLTLITDQEGSFSYSSASPSETGTSWDVHAHYSGEAGYSEADSNISTYDTVDLGTSIIPLVSGTDTIVTIEADSFDASVAFDELISDGSLFVSDCSSPDSSRYVSPSPIELCLQLSPTAQLGDGSFAHVTVSYAGKEGSIPEGKTESDLAMFHEITEGTLVDVTESIDLDANTITGISGSFSKFVVAVGTHSEKPANSARERVLVQDSQQVSYRDISNLNNVSSDAISLDQEKYDIGDKAKLTINDAEANIDSEKLNTIEARVLSSADSTGITITLEETEVDTGIFEGSFKLTSGSSDSDRIKVTGGSKLEIEYESTHPRASVIVDDITEAGYVEFSDFSVDTSDPDNLPPFKPIGKGMDVKLVDAVAGTDGKIVVTMSYANAALFGADPLSFKVMQRQGGNNWVPISPDQGAVDLESKTVTGETSVIDGQFSIGTCFGCEPGGAGGGGFTGRGVVVDAVASIARSSSGGAGSSSISGGSSTGSSNSFIAQLAAGLDVKLVAPVAPSSTVSLQFENVLTPGNVAFEEKSPTSLSSMFSEVTQTNGKVTFGNGLTFTTLGGIFDIKPSTGVSYQGTIDLTIPYNKNLLAGSSESDVRLLHFNGKEWEDATIRIDENAGTVTGRVTSLSPVVAAVINDGTFGATYFEQNPMARIVDINPTSGLISNNGESQITLLDAEGSVIVANTNSITAGSKISIVNSIKNLQRTPQSYTYILEVLDSNGVVIDLQQVRTGTLEQAQTGKITADWTAQELKGNYLLKIFVIDDLTKKSPLLLKNSISTNVEVT